MSKRAVLILFLGILALGAFFRFYLITETPLGLYPDEAMNGNNALETIATGDFKIFYPENNGREGLFINIQAISLWVFGNQAWALRAVSALFGTLTIIGLYLLTKELLEAGSRKLEAKRVALLASFFLATSFWHINFSRIGFRAIAVPFFSTFAIYFLLKGLRTGKISSLILAGISTGLGLQTYIAFRFMPFVLTIPILGYLWSWFQNKEPQNKHCTPCAVLLFIFVTFIVALPIGWYFLQNPQDFLGRSGQVSIFSAESPLTEFIKSNVATMGMFFVNGDCNWRHNLACQPQLHFLVAFFFLIGLIVTIRAFFKKPTTYSLQLTTLFIWFIFMTLPATLTREGLPHALRAIGMMPPVMILAGLGGWWLINTIVIWFENQKTRWPAYANQLSRIKRELTIFFVLLLLLIPLATYKNYFLIWANNPNTYFAFATEILHMGQYLKGLPQETKKYVMTNLSGVEVRGITMSAQTVMFVTDTFREEKRTEKNIYYLTPENWSNNLVVRDGEKTTIVFLNGEDIELINKIRERFPQFKVSAPSDFVILKNY